WTHLERQKGGIGMRGGPGETQLELDRRMLRVRIKSLREKLIKLKKTRGLQRRARKRSQVLSVSLVGYTNAGKSTLFNRLTQSGVYAADQLFATLDTTSRKFFIPESGPVVLSDTVGFIKHLPHALVEAFGATLEEAVQADLLLHVVDAASPNRDEQIMQVNQVLDEIGAMDVRQVLVLNQIDRLGMEPGLERDEYGRIRTIRISAMTGAGVDLVKLVMIEHQQSIVKKATEFTGFSEIDNPEQVAQFE
ncbi:MAG: GTPase HflX, partial [Nitrosomonadales bacterium]|nr:GTPase HflX [Nitrosomonadales bacterium]